MELTHFLNFFFSAYLFLHWFSDPEEPEEDYRISIRDSAFAQEWLNRDPKLSSLKKYLSPTWGEDRKWVLSYKWECWLWKTQWMFINTDPVSSPPAMLENCVSPENRHGHSICFGQGSMSRNGMCHFMIKEFNSLDYLSISVFSDCGDYWILYWYSSNGGSNTKTLVLRCIIADLENCLHSKWMTYVQTTLSLRHWYFGVGYYHTITYLNWCTKLT